MPHLEKVEILPQKEDSPTSESKKPLDPSKTRPKCLAPCAIDSRLYIGFKVKVSLGTFRCIRLGTFSSDQAISRTELEQKTQHWAKKAVKSHDLFTTLRFCFGCFGWTMLFFNTLLLFWMFFCWTMLDLKGPSVKDARSPSRSQGVAAQGLHDRESETRTSTSVTR